MIRFLIKCKFLCNSKRIKNNVTQKKVERNEKNPNLYRSFNVPKVCQILKYYARCMLGHFSKHKNLISIE